MLIEAQSISLNERVKNLSFSLNNGECLALLGRTGSGKSSALELLSKLEIPTSGKLSLAGKVGYLFQDSNLELFENSVYKEVSFYLRKQKVDKKRCIQKVKEALEEVDLDYEKVKDLLPYCLSGGESKRVALASLLVQECTIFLFDEPTVGLDKKGKCELMRIIKRLKAKGCGIIIASHDLEFIYELADKVIHLDKGSVTFSGSVEEFATSMPSLIPLTKLSNKLFNESIISFDRLIEKIVEVKNGKA